MYLILTILWLVGGIGLLVYQWASGDHRLAFHLGDTPISAAWIMLLLSAYNFLRWWSRRSSRVTRIRDQLEERHQQIRRLDKARERNPNFIFTEEPPAPKPPASGSLPP